MGQGCGSGSWKRLKNFYGSTLKKEAGSRSRLGSGSKKYSTASAFLVKTY